MMQRTLKDRVDVVGIGLHTGRRVRLELSPAPAGSGIRFVRADRGDASLTLGPGSLAGISRVDHATTLAGDGFTISTVEHLMAALIGMGVDNVTARLWGDEVPIMDGSAAPFVFLIKESGLRDLAAPRRVIVLHRPIGVVDGEREVTLYPADRLRITCTIDFAHPSIGRQSFVRTVDQRAFINELAPARTFCMLKDVEALRSRGLALGGSLANAVVVGDSGPLNQLRFHDEFVRHKALDLLGDLALLGAPVMGHVVAHKAGHAMHAKLLERMARERDAWSVVVPAVEPVPAGIAAPAAVPQRAAVAAI
jgi:UDP-3-O-[3-hydroxymyristoyl] N-acetylglucosamine deacetylase